MLNRIDKTPYKQLDLEIAVAIVEVVPVEGAGFKMVESREEISNSNSARPGWYSNA